MMDLLREKVKTELKNIIPPITFKEIRYFLLLFFSTRITLIIIGVLSHYAIGSFFGKRAYFSDKLWLDIWNQWDTYWYMDIAVNGYSPTKNLDNQANYAFFPLYPLLMKFLSIIFGDIYISGFIISNICLLISCIFLFNLVELDESRDIARRSVRYLFLFPTAYILSAVLTESLFLSLVLACFYYARKEDWFLVGLSGFFLSLTRSIGVFIFIPLLYEYLKSKRTNRDIFYLLLIPFGLLIFMIQNYYLTGDFLAFLHIQTAWDRSLANPLSVIYEGFTSSKIDPFFLSIFTAICLSMLIVYYNKIRVSYWIYCALCLIIPLSSGLYSMPRFALVGFPLFILFAKLTEEKDIDEILIISLALLQGCLMVFWSNGTNLIV
jgi:Gpi18-like mannosyltransferase